LLGLTAAFGVAGRSRSAFELDSRERVKRAISAVGMILVGNGRADSGGQLWPRGSAVLVRKDGVVATNLHVIEQDNSDTFYDELFLGLPEENGSGSRIARYRLRVALTSGRYDLALLRIVPGEGQSSVPKDFPAIDIGNSVKVQVLDDLTIIGYPETGGATVTVNVGIVEGTDPEGDWIKTDGRLMHGNSGGAAVDGEGKLVGIPTRIVLDEDKGRAYGAVGFLRPAHLVAAMLGELNESGRSSLAEPGRSRPGVAPSEKDQFGTRITPPATRQPQEAGRVLRLVKVQGVVRSTSDGKPIAGVRIGLIPAGSQDVTATTLLTWGGSNGDGQFEMNRKVPIGRYTLKARAIGYEAFTREVEIGEDSAPLVVGLEPSS